ncbi:MAG TPA: hypothetical protein VJ720_02340, partial [Chitinophaga sp.]|nr:hypothetical protein [Chitinophaga sp.]
MKEVQILINRYKAGTATPAQLKRLLQLLETDGATLQEWLRAEYDEDLAVMTKVLSEQRSADIWKKIQEKKEQRSPSPEIVRLPWRTISWAAASILLILAAVRLLQPVKH